MTLQLLHSEFPYICGKLDFLFDQCTCKTQVGHVVARPGGGRQESADLPEVTGHHEASISGTGLGRQV